MPYNTWFTPYKFPPSSCLSLGPSQGIVYQLSENAVVKLPFQYPIGNESSRDTDIEHPYLSLRSLVIFKKECAFYDLLAEKPHQNIARRQPSKYGIILEYLTPLERVWSLSTKETRLKWIDELLSALEWIEGLGYAHGDIKIPNLGIDYNHQLKLFDFGSLVHQDDDDVYEQILEDRFNLANCIHFLASGVSPLNKAECLTQLQQTMSDLRKGKGVVDKAAKDLEEIIQEGWTGMFQLSSSFSQLRGAVAAIIGDIATNSMCFPEGDLQVFDDGDWMAEKKPRWMNEENYRAAWKKKGYEAPVGIVN